MEMNGRINILVLKWRSLVGVLLAILCHLAVLEGKAQTIGGPDDPLRYSKQTYTVTMGNATNSVVWDIYEAGATRESIENGYSLPMAKNFAYYVDEQTQTGGISTFKVDFRGTLANGDYVLAYREESGDRCYIYVFMPFTLHDPFDVDLDPNNTISDTDCPDNDGVYLEGTGSPTVPVTYTTVIYPVVMVHPDDPPYETSAGNWSFNFTVTISGVLGATGIITQVDYSAFTANPNAATYTNLVYVPKTTTTFPISITYRDVPGVTQKIDFVLSQIEGPREEDDIDAVLGTIGENEKEHFLNAVPAASYIVALD